MTDLGPLAGSYGDGTTASGAEIQTDFDDIVTFLDTTGVHVYQAGTVIEAALATDAVTSIKIAALAVTTGKIDSNAVTTGKLATDAVTTAKIINDAVTTDKILNANVTTAKIAAGAVTFALLADDALAPRNVARVAAATCSTTLATENVVYTNPGTSTFGGATVVSGEVVLLTSQSTASQNGPWTFNGSGSAMTRPTWYDGAGDSFEGFEAVSLRGTYAGRKWRQTASGTITVDSTSTTWQMVGYMGEGDTDSRPIFSLVAPGGLYVDSEAGATFYLKDDSPDAWTAIPVDAGSTIAAGAITTDKLADAAITDEKMGDDAVAPRNVTRIAAVHISTDVNISNPGGSSFGGTTVVANGNNLGEVVLLAGQSDASQNGPYEFRGNAVAMARPSWYNNDATDLDGFEGMRFDVSRGDWSGTRWRLSTTGAIVVDTTLTTWQALGYIGRGATGSKPAATRIAAGGLYYDTTLSQLQRSDGSTWTALTFGADSLDSNAITTAKIADDAVTAAKIADGAIDAAAKLASDVVTTAKILDDAVTAAKIADGAIDATAKLGTGVVATGNILDGTIVNADISTNAEIDVSKLADGAAYDVLQTNSDGLTVAWVSGLTASHLASDAVTTAKILDANVTAAKLASDAVTTAKILDANVTAAKLASNAVTTAKILDANVTAAKLAESYLVASGRQIVTFTADGTFTKASYSNAKYARVRVQAAGGGGSRAISDAKVGSGGGGGGYAEKIIALSAMGTTETVTVGDAGAGGVSGAATAGGGSSFGTHVVTTGGGVGTANGGSYGTGGLGTVGTFVVHGGDGGYGGGDTTSADGSGGGSHLGNPAPTAPPGAGGLDANGYGAGGAGGHRNTVTDRAGGDGAAGIVIVELF